MLIDSTQNPQVKLARTLHSGKGRRESGLFLAEGPGVVAEALMYAPGIEWLAWCRDMADEDTGDIAEAAKDAGVRVYETTRKAFESLSDTRSPQGIAAVLRLPALKLADVLLPEGPCTVAVLHDVRDPGNVGSIIRSADALGASALVLTANCADPFEPKVVRATAGSLFHLPVVQTDWERLRAWAAEQRLSLVASAIEGEHSLGKVSIPPRAVVAIGNEAQGLPDGVLQEANLRVKIPMRGKAESLNASAAAAVLLYEAAKSREA